MEEKVAYLKLSAESSAAFTSGEFVEAILPSGEIVSVTQQEMAGEMTSFVITDKALMEKIYPYLIWNSYTTVYSKTMEAVECTITLKLDEYGNYKMIPYQFKDDAPIDEFIKEAMEKDAGVE